MSLLEDVFLQDEANEAQDLERIIEGDEVERERSDEDDENDSVKEDEAEEDKRRVDPTQLKPKRVIKNPRFVLNPARLTGPRGIQVLPEHFEDFKFKGKSHEKEDLDLVLKKLEHWAYRLYPKFKFEDCLKKIETLGKKRTVMLHLHRIRTDQLSVETVVQKDSSDEEQDQVKHVQEEDEFDKLLQQQIEIARSTPAPNSVKKPGFNTPYENRTTLLMPKATSSPSINDEQRERMLRNRKLAEERRLAKQQQNIYSSGTPIVNSTINNCISDQTNEQSQKTKDIEQDKENIIQTTKKANRSNVISSSDEECDSDLVNKPVVVDIHKNIDSRGNNDAEVMDTNQNNDAVDLDQNEISDNVNELQTKKANRSNVISSSDEESEISSVNHQSILADVNRNIVKKDDTEMRDVTVNECDDITVEQNVEVGKTKKSDTVDSVHINASDDIEMSEENECTDLLNSNKDMVGIQKDNDNILVKDL